MPVGKLPPASLAICPYATLTFGTGSRFGSNSAIRYASSVSLASPRAGQSAHNTASIALAALLGRFGERRDLNDEVAAIQSLVSTTVCPLALQVRVAPAMSPMVGLQQCELPCHARYCHPQMGLYMNHSELHLHSSAYLSIMLPWLHILSFILLDTSKPSGLA